MLVKSVAKLRMLLKGEQSIGFVPTMGFLHEGHLSLIRRARENNDKVVVSIFVNPTQFAPNEDFATYPRNIERDYAMAIEAGADIVFNPSVEEMYMDGASTSVVVEGDITTKLCGATRPTHFKGVTSVVTLLFNIVKPNRAYVGQKDAQQAIIIQKMVRDLHMDIHIVICPIVREESGLALSSRNTYLSAEEKQEALVLNQALSQAKDCVLEGLYDVKSIRDKLVKVISQQPLAKIDYVEIVSAKDLSDIETIEDKALAAVAVRFGQTRLIDNCFLVTRDSER